MTANTLKNPVESEKPKLHSCAEPNLHSCEEETGKVKNQRALAILDRYQTHELKDLGKASLMNREDTKFLLPIDALPKLLNQLIHDYSALSIEDSKVSTYRNTYFDTESMLFYHDHHNGRANRYKVRQRHYVESGLKFLEVKQKNNKSRTVKYRMKSTDINGGNVDRKVLINRHLNMDFADLKVSQYSGYQRIALADLRVGERLTLDFNLWFQAPGGGRIVRLPNHFIAELKQDRKTRNSIAYTTLSEMGYRPTALSKYCVGCAFLYKHKLKINRFKPVLSRLDLA